MDSHRHRGLRKRLIEILRERGLYDEKVLTAMSMVPRHAFFDSSAFAEQAYQDQAFRIGCEQTISQPSTVALQSTLLGLLPRQSVLEIGTGSAYQAAVLSVLGGRVFTLERHPTLYNQAKLRLKKLRYTQVRCFLRDGYRGLPEFAPFDRILVTCGAADLPRELLRQLKIGGTAVVPVGPDADRQRMLKVTRVSDEEYSTEDHGACAFVPFVEGLGD